MNLDLYSFNNLVSMTLFFDTEEKCRQMIVRSRWADGDVICPYCGQHHCNKRSDGRFRCPHCLKNFSCTVGTIFENTKVPLRKWFIAMYLISSHKKGISSYQLARDINVTQMTAWHMLQKIRILFRQYDDEGFSGTVECDEVYIGGKEIWKHKSMKTPKTQGRSTKTKTPVFGMMERSFIMTSEGIEKMTKAHAFVVGDTTKDTLQTLIKQFVDNGSHIISDELNAYSGLDKCGYEHSIVNHGIGEYAKGNISTNNIEGFWAHFRKMIFGCYHNVSDRYLQAYIDEAVFRWNTRKMSESQRFAHMFEESIGIVKRWRDFWLNGVA